jgi:prepilin-type N-terminal cleavage/methylation domain-containing protein/prepilin-type processing-associated H-X9-DG protein
MSIQIKGLSCKGEIPVKRAFTLIELLVVVTIISLLAAILFPVFARARETARRASCMSNMKQIGLALIQYTQDYDEKMPMQTAAQINDFAAPGAAMSWQAVLQPYVKSYQLFRCPSANLAATATAISDTSYFGNAVVLERITGGKFVPLSLAAIPEVSSVIVVQEYISRDNASYLRPAWTSDAVTFFAWLTDNYSNNHFGGGNLLFVDGHVKWKKHSAICAADFGLNNPVGVNACGTTVPATANASPLF